MTERSDEITSLVSVPITVCNVPDPKSIEARFVYNFYVANEDRSFSPQPTSPIDYSEGLIDRDTIDAIEARERGALRARVPRYVLLTISTRLKNIPAYEEGEISQDILVALRTIEKGFTNYNIEGVVENQFGASAQISDTGAKNRLQGEIYRIANALIEGANLSGETSDVDIALQLNELMSDDIDAASILDALSDNSIKGVEFVNTVKTRRFSRVDAKSAVRYSTKVNAAGYRGLTTDSILSNPFTHYFESDVLGPSADTARRNPLLDATLFPAFGVSSTESLDRLQPNIKILDISDEQIAPTQDALATKGWPTIKHVGYVIEKSGISSQGVFERYSDIVSTNPGVTEFIDPNVKYGYTYFYRARQLFVVEFIQVLDVTDTGEVVYKVVTAGIASSSPTPATVDTRERTPPRPPSTIIGSFIFRSGNGLRIDWAPPINPTRDIRKYQVFRRLSLRDPFEIIAEYDFTDEGYTQFEQREFIEPSLVRRVSSPQLSHTDYDFGRESTFIYCVASVDAHGLVSNYGTQLEVSFDRFANKIKTRVVSQSGAPRSYPNYYVDPTELEEFGSDRLVEDVIKDSGHDRMRVYFNPDAYRVASDDDGSEIDPIVLSSDRGAYKFQVINLDRQESKILTVTVRGDSTLNGIL